jgi:serine/threonine protein kinase
MSPQILNRNYDKSADIWSVGVVTYILLCGYSPFNGDQDDEVEKAIHACDYNFIHGWANKKDSRERLTADEALTHPWLNGVSTATRK